VNCAGHTASLRTVNVRANSEWNDRGLFTVLSHGMLGTAVEMYHKFETRRSSRAKSISGLPEYEDGGSACSPATFKTQKFVNYISQRGPPTGQINFHLSLVSSCIKPITEDTIQTTCCIKSFEVQEMYKRTKMFPILRVLKKLQPQALNFVCPTILKTKNVHNTASSEVKVFSTITELMP
jgi:hypothetical protein